MEVSDPSDRSKTSKKLVIGFEEYSKPMMLNNTSRKNLEKAFGTDDTAKWVGEKVRVSKQRQNVRGQLTDVLYLEAAKQ
ncbi:MAG TPA: hypothetical protein VF906_04175 [Candidatus Bathyarchaeia archaeon]